MNDKEDMIQFLIEMGVLKPAGYDEDTGEEMYLVTEEAEDLMPGISYQRQKDLNSSVFELWQRDMLDVVFNEDGEPLVALNKNSMDTSKINAIEDPDLRREMKIIVEIFSQNFNNNNK